MVRRVPIGGAITAAGVGGQVSGEGGMRWEFYLTWLKRDFASQDHGKICEKGRRVFMVGLCQGMA